MCDLLLASAILLAGVNVMRERPAVEYVEAEGSLCLQPRLLRLNASLEDMRAAELRWLAEKYPNMPVRGWDVSMTVPPGSWKFGPGPVTIHSDTAQVQLPDGESQDSLLRDQPESGLRLGVLAITALLAGEPVEYGKAKDHDCLQPRVHEGATAEDFRAAARRWLEQRFPGRPAVRWDPVLLLRPAPADGAGPLLLRGETAHVQLRHGTIWPVCFEHERVRGWPTRQAEAALLGLVGDDFYRKHLAFLPAESRSIPGSPDCASCLAHERRPHHVLVWVFRMAGKPFVNHRVPIWVDETGELLFPVNGMPDCKSLPARCTPRIDEAHAVRVARESGLEPGLRPWRASFGLHGDQFVWAVSNLLARDDDGSEGGKVVQIDATTGAVLQRLEWYSTF